VEHGKSMPKVPSMYVNHTLVWFCLTVKFQVVTLPNVWYMLTSFFPNAMSCFYY